MQQTIKQKVSISGTGVHTGTNSTLILHPGDVDTGIVFTESKFRFPAKVDSAIEFEHGVTLGNKDTRIMTCEHLLSALYGLGIDNCICELEGEEVPALDGSALSFVQLINKVGITTQKKPKLYTEIKEPVLISYQGRFIMGIPDRDFRISMFIDYNHKWLKPQYTSFKITPKTYKSEIAPARTYTFIEWLKKLKDKNLIRGGTLENAIVITPEGPINALRYEDEFVRHKILDLIGDLCLLGTSIKGHIFAIKPGHRLNYEFVKKLIDLCA